MGNGASCTRVEQFDESVQVPSVSPTKRSSTSSSLVRSHRLVPKKPSPIPPVEEEGFAVQRNIDPYSSVWDYDAKLSSSFNQRLKAEFSVAEHHQKETTNNKWTNKSSINVGSAYVESMLNTETHSCINLSTSEKIDELIQNLNSIHTQVDESIKRRTQQISIETESVLAHIINETQREQQRLLGYAKEQQTKQDEHYRDLLQNYISKLDEMKAKDLSELQTELQGCREQIMQVSQVKIMSVNEQANIMKSKIVKEEQQQGSMKIDAVNAKLQSLPSDETFQQLGSELMTKTHVTTTTHVGSKVSGQKHTFEFTQDAPKEKSNTHERPNHISTKTTSSDIKNEHRPHNGEVKSPVENHNPINSKVQRKESP